MSTSILNISYKDCPRFLQKLFIFASFYLLNTSIIKYGLTLIGENGEIFLQKVTASQNKIVLILFVFKLKQFIDVQTV